MPVARNVWHAGSLTISGAPSTPGTNLLESVNTGFQVTCSMSKTAQLAVVGATDLAPLVVSLDTIAKVRVLALRVLNGASIKVLLTSPKGIDQAFSTGDMFLWSSRNSGDEITGIKLVGTADVEIVIGGDVA